MSCQLYTFAREYRNKIASRQPPTDFVMPGGTIERSFDGYRGAAFAIDTEINGFMIFLDRKCLRISKES